MKQLRPLLDSRENNMMLEFSFWETSPPKITNGIYELRKYNLKVMRGNSSTSVQTSQKFLSLNSLDACWNGKCIGKGGQRLVVKKLRADLFLRRKGLECRRQFCEPVGAWFSQLGELHTVHHMWTYP